MLSPRNVLAPLFLSVFSLLLFAPAKEVSAQGMGIAAVVNDDVITAFDLDSRIRLSLLSAEIPDTPENRQRMASQAMQSLIEEALKRQEARRLGVTVPASDIERAIGDIEKRNNMPPGGMAQHLGRNGIPISTLEDQIDASLSWITTIRKSAGPRGAVSEAEVTQTLERIKSEAGKPQFNALEIFLRVDDPAKESDVHNFALRLIEQLGKGAQFQALASQFSHSPTAAVGGDLGWVKQGDVEKPVFDALSRMKVGSVSQPIRDSGGFRILALRDTRTGSDIDNPSPIQVELQQAIFPAKTPEEAAAAANFAMQQTAALPNCQAFEETATRIGAKGSGKLGMVPEKALNPDIRDTVSALPVNRASAPLTLPGAVLVFMVCSRTGGQAPSEFAQKEKVRNTLKAEKLEAYAEQLLRDLKKAAFVDLRQ